MLGRAYSCASRPAAVWPWPRPCGLVMGRQHLDKPRRSGCHGGIYEDDVRPAVDDGWRCGDEAPVGTYVEPVAQLPDAVAQAPHIRQVVVDACAWGADRPRWGQVSVLPLQCGEGGRPVMAVLVVNVQPYETAARGNAEVRRRCAGPPFRNGAGIGGGAVRPVLDQWDLAARPERQDAPAPGRVPQGLGEAHALPPLVIGHACASGLV